MLQNPIEPRPPELQAPWRTERRAALQAEARAFARDVVLPLADELDPRKGEMPRALIDQMAAKGWFGITIPAEHGGMGLGVFEYCRFGGTRPRLAVGRQHPGARAGARHPDDRRRAPP